MRRAAVLALSGVSVLAAGACRRQAQPSPSPRPSAVDVDAVASTRRGPLGYAAVEPVVRSQTSGAQAGTDAGGLVAAYRRAAEEIALRRALVPEADQLDRALEGLGAEREKIHREAVVEVYTREVLKPDLDVPERELRAYFEANRKRYQRPAERYVWHLFRRYEDPAHPEATVAFVEGLRSRLLAGESFADAAREHSHSETRGIGGRLGAVLAGTLPPPLEKVVFALKEGEITPPVRTSQGVMLFRVTDVVPETRFSYDDMRLAILRELREQRLDRALQAAAAGHALPAGSKVLDTETMRRAAALGDDEVVLEVDGVRLTLGQLRAEYQRQQENAPPPLDVDRTRDRFYQRRVVAQRLYQKAKAEGFVQRQAAALRPIEQALGARKLAELEIERRVSALVDQAEDEQKRFYEDNRFLYQTRLRLKLRVLRRPLGQDSAAALKQLEAVREELVGNRLDLDAAAARVGGTVRDLGWIDAAMLGGMEPKLRYYLMDMNSTGYTVAFHLHRDLSIVQVEAREEPRVKPYGEVKDAVRRDYAERSRQQHYRRVVETILEEEQFRFHQEAVLRRLKGPAAASPAAAGGAS